MSQPFLLRKQYISTGHRAAIYALVNGFSSDTVLTAGGDKWIVEWNAEAPETGRLLATTEAQVYSMVQWPGAERRLVAGNMNGGLHWVDVDNPGAGRDIQHHQKGVFDLLVAGDALYSAGGEGILSRWDLHTARPVESLHLSHRSLRTLAHHPLRREIAAGASDGNIYLLDADTFALRHTLAGAHRPSVFTICYHPSRPVLLSGGRDAMLRAWHLPDVEDKTALPVLLKEQPAHLFTLNHLVFAPDGRHFATASRDKTLKIWDADTFDLCKVADTIRDGGHINSVNRLLWRSDFLLSASDDRSLMWWATPFSP